jgi:hypothetical protein
MKHALPLAPLAAALGARLRGRKTYLIAALGLLYLFGGDQGWWRVSAEGLALLNLLGLAALRHGLAARTGSEGESRESRDEGREARDEGREARSEKREARIEKRGAKAALNAQCSLPNAP